MLVVITDDKTGSVLKNICSRVQGETTSLEDICNMTDIKTVKKVFILVTSN